MHRLIGSAALCALMATALLPDTSQTLAASQAKNPAAILAAARQALGGEARIDAIKTIVASGRTRQVRGENLVPIEFEISIELPDKYLRRDEIPAQESGPNASGFNGDELLQDPPPPSMPAAPAIDAARGGRGAPGRVPNPSAARVKTLKQDFARLMLGLLATSYSAYPLTFSYVAEAEAPQGTADVLEAKAADGFAMRVFISTSTHLPLMVTWQPPAPARGPSRGGPPPVAPKLPGAEGGLAAPKPSSGEGVAPESRLYFAEYQDVNGLQLPFRIRRAAGADTIEETTFDRYRINAKIDPKKFEVRK
jgi:hypothetical protein